MRQLRKLKINLLLMGACLIIALLLTGQDPVRELFGEKYATWIMNGFLVLAIILAFVGERRGKPH